MTEARRWVRPEARGSAPLFLVTGAVGFLGSYLMHGLLRAGCRVAALVRSAADSPAKVRLERILEWHGIGDAGGIELVEGDLASPGLGLPPDTHRSLARRVDGIVHCAACTSFSEGKRATIYASNVDGTARLLEFAETASLRAFHHVSTAYVAGCRSGTCAETIEDAPGFFNPYESSKHESERMVMEFGRRRGVPAYVHRPSIIVGDSVDGRTLRFNAMYFPVRRAQYLIQLVTKDVEENDGRLAAQMGVSRREDGRIHLPLRFDTGPPQGGILDLVPIDYVVTAVLAILESDAEPGVYHLVNPRPSSVAELVEFGSRYLNVTGVAACPTDAFQDNPMNDLERRLDADLEVYRPYLRDTRRFDAQRAERVLDAAGVRCSPFDYESFRRCIDFALACDWNPLSRPRAVGTVPVG